MNLEGLHHVTAITGDAPGNVDFYSRVLGLRMVKKTVNFDAPEAYHLYFGDEQGSPGSIMTWFEFAGVRNRETKEQLLQRILLADVLDGSLRADRRLTRQNQDRMCRI